MRSAYSRGKLSVYGGSRGCVGFSGDFGQTTFLTFWSSLSNLSLSPGYLWIVCSKPGKAENQRMGR